MLHIPSSTTTKIITALVFCCLFFHVNYVNGASQSSNAGAGHQVRSTGGQQQNSFNVHELNETNWRIILEDEWMVEFHAPWCPACRSLVQSWNDLSTFSTELHIQVAKIDVTESPALSGRFFVTALPTIFHVKNGEFRQYRGPRDIGSLKTMIKSREWRNIEPVSAWQYPDSIQMSIVAYFFKLSHYIKEANSYLHNEYHLPVALAYALFAIVTIFLGALLGLIFVCIVDIIMPPKRSEVRRKNFTEMKSDERFEDYPNEDFVEDDVRDESGSEAEKNSASDESGGEEAEEEEEGKEEKAEKAEVEPEAEEDDVEKEKENEKEDIDVADKENEEKVKNKTVVVEDEKKDEDVEKTKLKSKGKPEKLNDDNKKSTGDTTEVRKRRTRKAD